MGEVGVSRRGARPTQFDPEQAAEQNQQLTAGLKYLRDGRKWPELEAAAEYRIAWLRQLVAWWDANVRDSRLGSNQFRRVASGSTLLSADEANDLVGYDKTQVSKIRRKLKNAEQLKHDICGAAYKRAFGFEVEPERKRNPVVKDIGDALTPDNAEIHHTSIADAMGNGLAPTEVAAIITDPPYPEEDLYVYRQLGDFAMATLRPGGWLCVMVGQRYFAEILDDIRASGMEFRWQLCAHFAGGGHARFFDLQVFQNWKPIMVFQKPPRSSFKAWMGDYLAVPKSDQSQSQDLHKWQQGISVFGSLVEKFSSTGELIADPFLGAGTTGIAALSIGRQFWGCDIDAECLGIFESRMSTKEAL